MNILIVNGHPSPSRSFANQRIIEALQKLLPQATVHTLAEVCINGQFDVGTEQEKLRKADLVVLQFPLYWYALPGLTKTWWDEVFTYGFAYGASGNALHGKKLLPSLTTGASLDEYKEGGAMNHGIETYLKPLEQSACYCGLEWMAPVVSGGMLVMEDVSSAEKRDFVQKQAEVHARKVVEAIEGRNIG